MASAYVNLFHIWLHYIQKNAHFDAVCMLVGLSDLLQKWYRSSRYVNHRIMIDDFLSDNIGEINPGKMGFDQDGATYHKATVTIGF